MKLLHRLSIVFLSLLIHVASFAQFTRQDSLRGTVGAQRAWWNVKRYDVSVAVDIPGKKISGSNRITFEVLQPEHKKVMQIDLQEPMMIDKVLDGEDTTKSLPFRREGNVYWLDLGKKEFDRNRDPSIVIHYKGTPREAIRAPWDGGWVWTRDAKGRPWVTVACQGLGASVWYPCKDHQSDEPDKGASLSIRIPDSLVAVGNGRLVNKLTHGDATTTWVWEVKNPINSYNIVPYIGKYVNWGEQYQGEKGNLDCSYWVLDYDLAKSKKQFGRDVTRMFKCFENWFGPYPFYDDTYKLVETPHLGMEHQSAVAYGNQFLDGYLGTDLSGSGWGTKWDYIVVHETGHEWFANNITTNDIADMWVHEGFTNYSEVLFVECEYGKAAADDYCRGLRAGISNDSPVIGKYGVNKQGSGDMYAKGANLLHTVRQIIDNDSLFRQILRGLNKEFYHRNINTQDIEDYISRRSGKNLSRVFDQYLRNKAIPQLEYRLNGSSFSYRWTNCIGGFNMPVKIITATGPKWFEPTEKWQTTSLNGNAARSLSIDNNFYIQFKKVKD